MTEIDCQFTREIVCPYCGHVHRDSWEFGGGGEDGDDECGECGKMFSWSRTITVTYSTEKMEEDNGDSGCPRD